MQGQMSRVAALLPDDFEGELLSRDEHLTEKRAARNNQKLDSGIEAQTHILDIPAVRWTAVHELLTAKRLLTLKKMCALNLAMQVSMKIPIEKQCVILLDTLEKAQAEGISFAGKWLP